MTLATRSDDELIVLLETEGDRLPREAIEECARRGTRLLPILTEFLKRHSQWELDGPGFWAPIHATVILAQIGTPQTVTGLIGALDGLVEHEIDWLHDELPSIFARAGPTAVPLLRKRAKKGKLCLLRDLALRSLAGIASNHPQIEVEILSLCREIFSDGKEDPYIRGIAADILMDFRRDEDRERLTAYAEALAKTRESGPLQPIPFDPEDVAEAYSKAEPDLSAYRRDWMTFYDPVEIQKRQERWEREAREEEERARWKALSAGEGDEEWFIRETDRIQADFAASQALQDLTEDTRNRAVRHAFHCMEFLVRYEGYPPWEWSENAVEEYLLDFFPRKVSLGDEESFERVPDYLARFICFWEEQGKFGKAWADSLARHALGLKQPFIREAADPANFGPAKQIILQMKAEGVDLTNREQVDQWIARSRR